MIPRSNLDDYRDLCAELAEAGVRVANYDGELSEDNRKLALKALEAFEEKLQAFKLRFQK